MTWKVLLRLDNASGPVTPPFEQPNPGYGFWVCEITVDPQATLPAKTIEHQLQGVRDFIPRGSRPVLFIEAYANKPIQLPDSLITLLAELKCGLELRHTA